MNQMTTCMARLAIVVGLGLSGPALAQESPADPTSADWADVQTCLEMAREAGASGVSCVGTVSGPCIEQPGNSSTPMMGACYNKEATIWDEILNDHYAALRESLDPEQFGYLRDSQRAWITTRDATCQFEASLWGGGTGAGPAAIGCIMRETGQRATSLGAMLDMVGN